MFESYTDEQLITMLHTQADACVRIVQMSPTERHHSDVKKGSVSPEQAGTMNAMFAVLAEAEAVRRGLVAPTLS